MINVSNEFYNKMQKNTNFKQRAEVTLKNGNVINLSQKDFALKGNSIFDGSESNGIPLGSAICRSIRIDLNNDDDHLSEYDFFGARIRLFLIFELEDAIESIEFGTFTVDVPETYGTTVSIVAVDDMYKADAEYTTNRNYPMSLQEIFVDICNTISVDYRSANFRNKDFVVNEKPDKVTFRQMLGYIAMLAAGNARFDRLGRLEILEYDFTAFERIANVTGGTFEYKDKTNYSGGTFAYNDGDNLDGGGFLDDEDYAIAANWKSLKLDTDDVVITGVSTTRDVEVETEDKKTETVTETIMYGQSGYVLSINNPLAKGKEQSAIEKIGAVMIGGRFRAFEGDCIANPLHEFMDLIMLIDRKGNTYQSFLTDINFVFGGITTLKNSALSAVRNQSTKFSQAAQTFVEARKLINQEKSEREIAMEGFAKELANASGLFITEQEQQDHSIIYYMHDKKNLAESKVVWKLTANAIGVSTDGGKTYPYGLDANGTAILERIYTIGLNADYVTAGTITGIKINNGNGTFEVDENGNLTANALTSNNATITGGKIDIRTSNEEYNVITLTGKLDDTLEYESSMAASIFTLTDKRKGQLPTKSLITAGGFTAETYTSVKKLSAYMYATGVSVEYEKAESHLYSNSLSIKNYNDTVYLSSTSITFNEKQSDELIIGPVIGYKAKDSYNDIRITPGSIVIDDGKTTEVRIDTAIGVTAKEFRAKGNGSTVLSYKYSTTTTRKLIQVDSSGYPIVGELNGKVGFFGSSGDTRQTVSNSTYTSSTTAKAVGDDLNTLKTALRKYGLIN